MSLKSLIVFNLESEYLEYLREKLGQTVTGCFRQESRQEKVRGPRGCWTGVGTRVERRGTAPGCSGPLGCSWTRTHWPPSSELLLFPWGGHQWSQTGPGKETACIYRATHIWTNTWLKDYLKVLTTSCSAMKFFWINTPNSEYGHLLLENFNEVSHK